MEKPHFFQLFAFLLFLFSISPNFGQNNIDTLTHQELVQSFNTISDSTDKIEIGKQIVARSKATRDTANQVTGFYLLSTISEGSQQIEYLDAIIQLTREQPTPYQPALSYILKGAHYYEKEALQTALDNFLEAYAFARAQNNADLISMSSYYIGLIRNHIGDYARAYEMFSLHFNSFQQRPKNSENYLTAIYAMADIHNRLKQPDSATYYYELGYEKSEELQNDKMTTYFKLIQSQTEFLKQHYFKSIPMLQEILPKLRRMGDNNNLAETYYYLGESYWQQQQAPMAVERFKSVDSLFTHDHILNPEVRLAFLRLIDYYETLEQPDQELYYLNQLLRLEEELNKNEAVLHRNIFEAYEVPNLLQKKESLIAELQDSNSKIKFLIPLLSVGLLALLGISYYQFRKNQKAKKRVQKLLQAKEVTNITPAVPHPKEVPDTKIRELSEDTISKIQEDLQQFEKKQGYLNSGIAVSKLAKQLGTNSRYLSIFVNHFKEQSFSNYINQLRIQYAIDRLKSDVLFQKYTIKAISEDSGFNNPESFSKAFQKFAGIKPSYFIKELQKSKFSTQNS